MQLPYYADDWLTVYHGDSRAVIATLPAESVHCVVTSPPYWRLRDYGTASWTGGDEGCDHAPDKRGSRFASPVSAKQASNNGSGTASRADCDCGAQRIDSQLGLEATPEEFVANMVAVFREVRRVLRPDGTLWLNLGDSYAGGAGGRGDRGVIDGRAATTKHDGKRIERDLAGRKPKDLVGIPWKVAFALQADGWYLRSDIIWAKPNPMPESVTDRPTKSHEYIFLLAKSARYYFDADAVREPHQEPWRSGTTENRLMAKGTDGHDATFGGWDYDQRIYNPAGRNLRTVWNIATAPYPGAHFATFPPKLVEPCVKAGCPEGGVVLDPFAGSGTTGMVAQSLSRRAVLIDLSMDYLGQLMERNRDIPLGLGA